MGQVQRFRSIEMVKPLLMHFLELGCATFFNDDIGLPGFDLSHCISWFGFTCLRRRCGYFRPFYEVSGYAEFGTDGRLSSVDNWTAEVYVDITVKCMTDMPNNDHTGWLARHRQVSMSDPDPIPVLTRLTHESGSHLELVDEPLRRVFDGIKGEWNSRGHGHCLNGRSW